MMGDNDFPYQGDYRFRDLLDRGEERKFATLPLPNKGGVPNRPYNPSPEPAKPTQPEEGFDEFREKYGIPRTAMALQEPHGFLREYISGRTGYSQEGTEIPSLRLQKDYAQEAGGPLFEQDLISGTPSFNIDPDIDSPIIDQDIKKLQERHGVSKTNMKELERNSQRLRNMIRGI
jgi:hypothetical protein